MNMLDEWLYSPFELDTGFGVRLKKPDCHPRTCTSAINLGQAKKNADTQGMNSVKTSVRLINQVRSHVRDRLKISSNSTHFPREDNPHDFSD